MRLSDLRPCDGCGGPLILPPERWFHVVRPSGAIVTEDAMRIVQAAAAQGVPLERIEAAQCPGAVVVLADSDQALGPELLLCVSCYHARPIAEIALRYRYPGELQAAKGRAS